MTNLKHFILPTILLAFGVYLSVTQQKEQKNTKIQLSKLIDADNRKDSLLNYKLHKKEIELEIYKLGIVKAFMDNANRYIKIEQIDNADAICIVNCEDERSEYYTNYNIDSLIKNTIQIVTKNDLQLQINITKKVYKYKELHEKN